MFSSSYPPLPPSKWNNCHTMWFHYPGMFFLRNSLPPPMPLCTPSQQLGFSDGIYTCWSFTNHYTKTYIAPFWMPTCIHVFILLVLGLQLRAEFHLLCYFSCNHYLICQSVVVQPHSQTTRRETLETRLMPAYTLDMKQKQNYLQGLVSLVAVYM